MNSTALSAARNKKREMAKAAQEAAIAELLRRHHETPRRKKTSLLQNMANPTPVDSKAKWGSHRSLQKYCSNVNFKEVDRLNQSE